MFFEDWPTIARTALVVPLAYLALLIVVRVSGKRALSQLNAFDLVVTVALGSVLASVAVSPDVTLASGALVLALLVGLQYAIAFLSVRVRGFPRFVKARPTLVVRDGRLLDDAMEAQRVTTPEILQVLRRQGLASPAGVAAVVLETDGTFSVVRQPPPAGEASTLADVPGWR